VQRLSRNAKGQAVLQLKSPYRDGTTHIVMSAQEFMQRLAALARMFQCAVQRRCFPVGANPTRQLSLQPEAIGAIVEVTKRLKPSV